MEQGVELKTLVLLLISMAIAPTVITTKELNKTYPLYENKPVTVTGKVLRISSTYILYLTDNAIARITDKELYTADRFKVNQTVVLACIGAGYAFTGPLLLECSRVEP